MELDELHVEQRNPGAIRDRHPVARAREAIRRFIVGAAGAAGGQYRGLCSEALHGAVSDIQRHDTRADAVLDGERGRRLPLLVDFDVEALALLPQRVQDDEPGDVGAITGAGKRRSAERALRDAPVVHSGEDAAHVIEPDDRLRRFVREELDGVLIAEVVGALDRVEGVGFGGVFLAITKRGVDAALRCAAVTANRMDLRQHSDVEAEFSGFHCGAHAGEAAADDKDVVLEHRCSAVFLVSGHRERESR